MAPSFKALDMDEFTFVGRNWRHDFWLISVRNWRHKSAQLARRIWKEVERARLGEALTGKVSPARRFRRHWEIKEICQDLFSIMVPKHIGVFWFLTRARMVVIKPRVVFD